MRKALSMACFCALTLLMFGLMVPSAMGQALLRDSSLNIFRVEAGFGAHLPQGDLARRFGHFGSLEGGVVQQWKKGWELGLQGQFFHGEQVREPGLFRNISTPEGAVLNENGQFANIRVYMRGWAVLPVWGLRIQNTGNNPNSGLILRGGLGYLHHKLHIVDVEGNTPAISGDYAKGYDRFTSGIMGRAGLGYLYIDGYNRARILGELQLSYAPARERRSFNLDEQRKVHSIREDVFIGARLVWVLPFYDRKRTKHYY